MIVWDRDGTGPLPAKLVVSGEFNQIGGVQAQNVAAYNLESRAWESLGAGLREGAASFVVLPNGDLVAGGRFTASGSAPLNHPVVQWDGMSWSAIGTGLPFDYFNALVVLPSGELVAGGYNTAVQLWNGVSWLPVGETPLMSVWRMAIAPDGALIAARSLLNGEVHRYDGHTWNRLGMNTNGQIRALAVLPDSSILIAGDFEWMGGELIGLRTSGVARWDGTSWSAIGPLSPDWWRPGHWENRTLLPLPNGDLIVGKRAGFMANVSDAGLRRWNGQYWSRALPGSDTLVYSTVLLPDGRIAVSNGSVYLQPREGGSVPIITAQPSDVTRGPRSSFNVRVSVSDPAPLNYYWRFNGVPIDPAVSVGGPGLSDSTILNNYRSGMYDCVISNGCNAVITQPFRITICYADLADGSAQPRSDGGVTVEDLLFFLDAYSRGDRVADLDNGTGTGRQDQIVSFEDLVFFLSHYAEGC